jgi:predicted N-acetyltransferase YhbS
MGGAIVMRRAETRADKLAVLAIARDATRPDAPLLHDQALRLAAPKRRTAEWWLLEVDGAPVASLLSYPLVFGLGPGWRQPIQGYGLGAVATDPRARREAFATALCRHVGEVASAEGRPIGLLYTAIAPGFYERIGYRRAPAVDRFCDDVAGLAASGDVARLTPLDPCDELPALAECYARARLGLHLHRGAAELAQSVHERPHDLFFTASTPARSYLRLAQHTDSLEILECESEEPGTQTAMVRAAAALASAVGVRSVHTWAPLPPLVDWLFDRGRFATQPMVKGVAEVADAWFAASDYF